MGKTIRHNKVKDSISIKIIQPAKCLVFSARDMSGFNRMNFLQIIGRLFFAVVLNQNESVNV